MYNQRIIFYILSMFVIFGGGFFDTRYVSLSNLTMNLALLAPFLILKSRVHIVSKYLNKSYELDELKKLLINNGNISERDLKKYIRHIDIINDIDEDGVNMTINNIIEFTKNNNMKKEVIMILNRIDSNNIQNSLNLFDLKISNEKILKIISGVLNNLKNN